MLKGPIHILKEDSVLQGLIGENEAETKTKVYPVFCPQPESPPYIVLRQTGKAFQGRGSSNYEASFDVYSYAKSYDDCEAIDLAVVSTFKNTSRGTYNSVTVGYVNFFSTRDEHVAMPDPLYVKVSSFTIGITE